MAHRARRARPNVAKQVVVEFPPRQPWWLRLFQALHISPRSW